ncbi:MAG: UDP-N-acetylglucosamine 1-carboxyvinyltransferase [Oscillospiraceae bacterium]|jgi:UDP-N-acetylglucosamine 1-carboxyvinyltransferase|nr:UDP-N-acetylglucosamine 1-carboxyvinyltransferase [Oscillospiraceae bacterium]
MSKMKINGGRVLNGEIAIHGAKNSVLPVLAATLISNGVCEIHNCPRLSDVAAAVEILKYLGCRVWSEGSVITIDSSTASKNDIPDELMREMRSSISFLGAIIARMGSAKLSLPGGCELGARPIDLHLSALRRMGVSIEDKFGCIDCEVEGTLHGEHISLSFPSVGATENIMVVASAAKGTTVITNAAREPEISDLARFLNSCGAKISGYGEGTIVIEGVEKLHGTVHRVIPDRIEAATYMAAAAITGGNVRLTNISTHDLSPVIPVFEETGCGIITTDSTLLLKAPKRPHSVQLVRTMPHPGFPTDAQAIVMAITTIADGTSLFVENIFENRFKHTWELCRFGASIKTEGRIAVVEGVPELFGTQVNSTDLRGSAAIVVAGLAAEGTTIVSGLHHLDRGYEDFERGMCSLGADMKRID